MDAKLFKVCAALMGLGSVCMTSLYGKLMYAKGRVDADAMYKPILEADNNLIRTLVEKLQKAESRK